MTSLLFLHPVGLDGGAARWLGLPGLVAPDLPGHGVRAHEPVGGLDDIADAVAAGMDEPADVVGALFGGAVGLHLALRHPGLVASLALAGTDLALDPARLSARADAIERGETRAEDVLPSWFGAHLDDPGHAERVGYARSHLRGMRPESLAAAWRALAGHDVADAADRLRMPVTVIAASHDEVHPPDRQAGLARELPLARAAMIDAHHMSVLDAPPAFAGAVRAHVAWADGLRT